MCCARSTVGRSGLTTSRCAPWRCALLGSQMLVRRVALLVAVVATQADEAPTTTGTTGFLASALASMTEVVPASASTVGVLTSTQATMEQNKNRKRTHEPAVEPPHASAGVAVQAGTTGQPARKKRQAKGADVRLERTKRAAALGLSTKIRALTDAVEAVCGREARNNAERSIVCDCVLQQLLSRARYVAGRGKSLEYLSNTTAFRTLPQPVGGGHASVHAERLAVDVAPDARAQEHHGAGDI